MSFPIRFALPVSLGAFAIAGVLWSAPAFTESAARAPAPKVDMPAGGGTDTAIFAGGCFWGIQAVFEHVKGVSQAVSGYSGGDRASPTYEEVSSGDTGHAESVRVRYDPSQVSYGQLLQVFFSVAHDPTELNRQGPDTGTQYRSALFYTSAAQKKVAEAYVEQLRGAKAFSRPIVTEITAMSAFYPAEGYHQDYAITHPDSAYIVFNDLPKVENLQRLFPDLYRTDPVRVASAE